MEPTTRNRALPIVICGVLIGVTCTQLLMFGGMRWQPRHTIATMIIVPSYMIWATARWQLGPSFTTRAEARRLVTGGIYSRIRHPIYVGGTLTLAGLVTYSGFYFLYLGILVFALHQLRRARREDRVLDAAFGEDYRRYRRGTWI